VAIQSSRTERATGSLLRRVLRVAAWLLFAFIVFATLSPIDLRPVSLLPVNLERAAAFAVLGVVFALAYPRHMVLVAGLIAVTAVGLEVLQILGPGRHGRLLDLLVKAAGGLFGIAMALVLHRVRQSRISPEPR